MFNQEDRNTMRRCKYAVFFLYTILRNKINVAQHTIGITIGNTLRHLNVQNKNGDRPWMEPRM